MIRWIIWVMALVLAMPASAIDLKRLQQVQKMQQHSLIAEAREAASGWRFGEAKDLLEQAERQAYNPTGIAEARKYVAQQQDAKAAHDRRVAEEEERKRQEELARQEAERQMQLAKERRDASGNMGGSLSCSLVSSDYGLWNYCTTGACSGFSSNYGLWNLCQNDEASGLSSNYGVWSYLKSGDASGLAQDYQAWQAAKQNAGSFADRKRFVIYYLRGYTY